MRGAAFACAAVCLLVAAACVVQSAAPAAASSFSVACASSHSATDDPIVFPGQSGASHVHEFYGARGVNAFSTLTSLRRARTTCAEPADTASYWIPQLSVRGRAVRGSLTAYYARGTKPRAAAPPAGLKVLAGEMSMERPQSLRVVRWGCSMDEAGRVRQGREPVHCPRGTRLTAWILFPDCWDARRLDSVDHRSHLAYAAADGSCPPTHPAPIMKLTYRIQWPARPIPDAIVLGGMLPPSALHADFWNGWHQARLEQLRWDCIEVARPCGARSSDRRTN